VAESFIKRGRFAKLRRLSAVCNHRAGTGTLSPEESRHWGEVIWGVGSGDLCRADPVWAVSRDVLSVPRPREPRVSMSTISPHLGRLHYLSRSPRRQEQSCALSAKLERVWSRRSILWLLVALRIRCICSEVAAHQNPG
jgi:hypothetical protein